MFHETHEPIWYYRLQGRVIGPVTLAALRELVRNRRLAPTDDVCRAGQSEWGVAGSIAGLFGESSSSTVPRIATPFTSRLDLLADAHVVPESHRCVQCGICSHNCPMGIDVRGHAHRGRAIFDSHCLTCSACVQRCPRGVLRFERISRATGQ